MSTKSTYSTANSVSSSRTEVQNRIKTLVTGSTQCNMKGQSGIFVSKEALGNLESDVLALISNEQDPELKTALVAANQQLQELRKAKDLAEDRVKASEISASHLRGDLENMRVSLDALKRTSKADAEEVAKAKAPLLQELDDLKAQLATSKKAYFSRIKEGDNEFAEVEFQKKQQLAEQVTRLNNLLQAEGARLAQNKATIFDFERKIKVLEEEKKAAERNAERFKRQSYADVAGEPDAMADYAFKSKFLGKVWPTKAIDYLKEAAALRRDETREKAYKLLLASKSADPKAHLGFQDLASSLYESIKSSDPTKRKNFNPLLNKIFSDISSKTGLTTKALKEAKKSLAEIADFSQEKLEREAAIYPHGTWWGALKIDLKCLYIDMKTEYQKKRNTFWTRLGYETRPQPVSATIGALTWLPRKLYFAISSLWT